MSSKSSHALPSCHVFAVQHGTHRIAWIDHSHGLAWMLAEQHLSRLPDINPNRKANPKSPSKQIHPVTGTNLCHILCKLM